MISDLLFLFPVISCHFLGRLQKNLHFSLQWSLSPEFLAFFFAGFLPGAGQTTT